MNKPEEIPGDTNARDTKNETFNDEDAVLEAMPQKPPRTPTVAHHNLNKTK